MRVFKLFVLLVVLMAFGLQDAYSGEAKWDNFSKNLVIALKSDNEGLRRSAMNLIVRYGESLNVDEAVFDVVQIFRYSDNQKERRLALIALYKMQNDWSMYFLKRHMKFEDNPTLKHQIAVIVQEYYGTDQRLVAGK